MRRRKRKEKRREEKGREEKSWLRKGWSESKEEGEQNEYGTSKKNKKYKIRQKEKSTEVQTNCKR